MSPSVDLINIKSISPNGSGRIDVPSDLNLTGTAPNPVYRINGIPLAFANADGSTINLANITNVNGQPYGPAGATGQIQYRSSSGAFGASANLYWDATNSRLGIGTEAPQANLDLGASGGTLAPLADVAFDNAQIAGAEKRVAIIQARTDTSINSGVLTFQTMFVGGTLYEHMRITSRGFVGIGTQAPQVRCEVNGLLRMLAVTAGSLVFPTSGKGLEIYYWDGGAGNETGVIECRNRTGGVNMPFAIRGNPLAFNQLGGNVGIGTNAPQATLDIGTGGVGSAVPRIYLSGDQNQPYFSVGELAFRNTDLPSADKRLASIETWTDNPTNSGYLTFSTASAGVMTERMRIDSQGRYQFSNLRSTQPAAGSRELWYDPTDGNRVKYAP